MSLILAGLLSFDGLGRIRMRVCVCGGKSRVQAIIGTGSEIEVRAMGVPHRGEIPHTRAEKLNQN